MILSELIDRLADIERRHGPDVRVGIVVKIPRPGILPAKYEIGNDVVSVGTSGRKELEGKIVIYGTKDGEK